MHAESDMSKSSPSASGEGVRVAKFALISLSVARMSRNRVKIEGWQTPCYARPPSTNSRSRSQRFGLLCWYSLSFRGSFARIGGNRRCLKHGPSTASSASDGKAEADAKGGPNGTGKDDCDGLAERRSCRQREKRFAWRSRLSLGSYRAPLLATARAHCPRMHRSRHRVVDPRVSPIAGPSASPSDGPRASPSTAPSVLPSKGLSKSLSGVPSVCPVVRCPELLRVLALAETCALLTNGRAYYMTNETRQQNSRRKINVNMPAQSS
jgi:hypothetical protein